MSRWPVIFGVVGILTAAFSLLAGGCDMVVPAGSASAPTGVPSPLQPWSGLLDAVDFVLAVLLLAASIGMLRRRDWSVRAAVLWSWAKSVSAIGGTILTAVTFRQGVPALLAQFGMTIDPGTENILLVGTVCISLVLGLSTPIFVLLWFRRTKVREEVAGWSLPHPVEIR